MQGEFRDQRETRSTRMEDQKTSGSSRPAFKFTGSSCCHPCKPISLHRRGELGAICKNIRTPAGPSKKCTKRSESDRFVPGTRPVLRVLTSRNGMIWTGARNGTEIVYGDVLLDKGLVVAVGYIPPSLLNGLSQSATTELRVEDPGGAWVTPGLVDLHSHLGVSSVPELSGHQQYCCWNIINGFYST
jgi:hypothetical protein